MQKPTTLKLSNGLTVLYLHTPQDPIAASHLLFPVGAAHEPVAQSGITMMMCSVLHKGTKHRNARKLAEDIESIGAYIGAGATQDYWEISCHSTGEVFEQALRIKSEVLFQPAFARDEVEKEKQAMIAAIRSKKESIFTVTNELLNQNLYPNHPYARPSTGTEKTVSALTPDQLVSWHKKLSQPEQAVLAIASNIPLKTLQPTIEKLFGPTVWSIPHFEPAAVVLNANAVKEKVEVKSPSRFEQAYLMMGFPAGETASKDYIALKVLNGVLGGGMSARLFQTLREKEGLAYDVGSYYPSKRYGSALIVHMGLQASKLTEAKAGILREIEKIRTERVPEKELNFVKNHLKGTFILDHQTNSQRAHYLGWWETLGLGAYFDQQFVPLIDSVTVQQVHDVAQRVFSQPYVLIETHPETALAENARA